MRSPKLVSRTKAALLVVDIQEKLAAAMDQGRLGEVTANVVRMIGAARELGLPIVATEQYPKGLGPTTKEVADALGEVGIIEKLAFSAMGVEATLLALKDARARDVLIVGMEAHVCVSQTTYDLDGLGFRPVVLADAVISRYREDCETALERFRHDGIAVTTTEAAIFELLEEAGTEMFKRVRSFIRLGSREEQGEKK